MHLTRIEFIDFFSSPNFLDRAIYHKIYPYLNDVTKAVFNTFFEYIKSDYEFSHYVEELHLTSINLVRNNPYLSSEQAYLETRRRLKNLATIPSKVCPAHKIDKMFTPKDIIILSNVLQNYINKRYNNDFNFVSQTEIDSFVRVLKNTLTEDGLVSLMYMLCGDDSNENEIREYFNIKGNLRQVKYKDWPWGYHQVFIAKKEDFPEFER